MNKYQIVCCKVDCEPEILCIPATMDKLQEVVGGCISTYPTALSSEGIALLCDSDGIPKRLKQNYNYSEPIFGNFIFIGIGDNDFKSLTYDQTKLIMEYFKKMKKLNPPKKDVIPGWVKTNYYDEYETLREGYCYTGPIPEKLSKIDIEIWKLLCTTPNVLPELLHNIHTTGGLPTYSILEEELNRCCLSCSIIGPAVVNYPLIIAYYLILLIDVLEHLIP